MAEVLNEEDVAILKLESPRIAGHVAKILTVEAVGGGLGVDALREHVMSRLHRMPRMMQRLSDEGGELSWVADADFDVRNPETVVAGIEADLAALAT